MTRREQRHCGYAAQSLIAITIAASAGCATAGYDAERNQHPTLTFPERFEEAPPRKAGAQGKGAKVAAPGNADASSPAKAPDPAFDATTLPEPAPLNEAVQWEYRFAYDSGKVSVAKLARRQFASPVVSARRVGRFGVELWIGRELIDRIRFDFPLLAGEAVPQGPATPIDAPIRFGPHAKVEVDVLVPASERATRAELVDFVLGTRSLLPWPPDAPIEAFSPGPAPPVASSPSKPTTDAAAGVHP